MAPAPIELKEPKVTTIPTMSPTKAPVTSAPTGVCPGLSPQARSFGIREMLLEITSEEALDTVGSPQFQAAQWLMDDDARSICPTAENLVIQRFALAALYYSTDGDKWKFCSAEKGDCSEERFLSEASVCDWYGIECNNNLRVTEVKLEACKSVPSFSSTKPCAFF